MFGASPLNRSAWTLCLHEIHVEVATRPAVCRQGSSPIEQANIPEAYLRQPPQRQLTMSSVMTPAVGARTSMVTLSVSICAITSSSATASPGALAMVPGAIVPVLHTGIA